MRKSFIILLSGLVLAFLIVPAYAASNYYNGKIVWAASRDSNWEIYIMNDDSSNQKRLTFDQKSGPIDQHPVFTPDGSKIVWSRDYNIYIMNTVDGSCGTEIPISNCQQLTTTGRDNHPWVNPNGTKIYFNRLFNDANQNRREIWRMDLNGSNQERVMNDTLNNESNRWHPSVRYDELIVYGADNSTPRDNKADSVRTYDPNTGIEKTIYAPGWHVSAASWDPSGSRIILSEDPNGTGVHQIITIDADGTDIKNGTNKQVLTNRTYHDFTPYFEYPAGSSRIDFVRKLNATNTDIFRMDLDGTNQADLSDDSTPDLTVVEPGSCSPTLPTHPFITTWGRYSGYGTTLPVWDTENLYYFSSSSNPVSVYVSGQYFVPNQTYPLYIVQNRIWSQGDTILSPVVATTVTTDSNGAISQQLVWNSSTPGSYDVIIDVDNNMKYDPGRDPLDTMSVNGAGFQVIQDTVPPSIYPLYSIDNYGIVYLKVSDVVNAIITVQDYPTTPTTPSNSPQEYTIVPAKKTVTYSRSKINPYYPASYRITAIDAAGNAQSACPVFFTLSREAGKPVTYNFTILSTEKYFHINNSGVTNILFNISGHEFKLIAQPNKLGQENDTYYIPEYGEYDIDLSPYLVSGNNSVAFEARGRPGGSAEMMISE